MIKSIYSIIIFLFIHYLSFGQDTLVPISFKNQFHVQTGIFYKNFLSGRYIEPKPDNSLIVDPYKDFKTHQYERFTKKPTFGFSTGILFTHTFNKHWGITTGMTYFLKRDVFENNQDTVIKYGNGSSMKDIRNALKYDYIYHTIEIPIMAQYVLKKTTFYVGTYVSLLAYKKSTYTYVINQFPQAPQWTTSDKTVSGFELPMIILPTIQASYQMQIKNRRINPYLAFYYALKKQNDFYMQLGINFPLNINP